MNSKQANKIPIVDFLATEGFMPTKDRGRDVWYISPLRTPEKTASFKVDTELNKWYDHGTGEGGGLLDLALSLFKLTDVSECLSRLGGRSFHIANVGRGGRVGGGARVKDPPAKVIITGVTGLTEKSFLISYLRTRKIPLDLATTYCKAVDFTIKEKNYYAIGFRNRAGGYELRNAYFKGSSSPKDITLVKNGSKVVSIFEGFIDFLSGLAAGDQLPVNGDFLVLNSLALLEKNLDVIRPYQQAICFFDNDAAGQKGLATIKDTGIEVVNASELYKGFKDVNDWHCARSTQHPRARRAKF